MYEPHVSAENACTPARRDFQRIHMLLNALKQVESTVQGEAHSAGDERDALTAKAIEMVNERDFPTALAGFRVAFFVMPYREDCALNVPPLPPGPPPQLSSADPSMGGSWRTCSWTTPWTPGNPPHSFSPNPRPCLSPGIPIFPVGSEPKTTDRVYAFLCEALAAAELAVYIQNRALPRNGEDGREAQLITGLSPQLAPRLP